MLNILWLLVAVVVEVMEGLVVVLEDLELLLDFR
jgi:hypothetical protein